MKGNNAATVRDRQTHIHTHRHIRCYDSYRVNVTRKHEYFWLAATTCVHCAIIERIRFSVGKCVCVRVCMLFRAGKLSIRQSV